MRFLIGTVLVGLIICSRAIAQDSPLMSITTADWAGADDLGRRLPGFEQTGATKQGHYVGLFYWQWHTGLRATSDVDMTEYLKGHPKQMDFLANPKGGPKNPTYYWGQPALGYYRSDDPWVMRKHLSLLAGAGVDFLFLDYTNGSIYERELGTFLKVSEELKRQGMAVPRLTFFLNSEPEWKIETLYRNWYKPGKFEDRWFRWTGKPLMMGPMPTDGAKLKDPSLLKEIQEYFTFRPTWALEKADKDPHLWRFLSEPEKPPAVGPDGKIEQMVVNKSMGGPIWGAFKDGGVSRTKGRSFTAEDYDAGWLLPDRAEGFFFQSEWDHAKAVNPPILLVTGWNEWTASVWEQPGVVMLGRPTGKGQGHIVDEFNQQFNRDVEPIDGGYGDAYFWQFLSNLREYKGMERPAVVSAKKTMDVAGPASAWDGVTPTYHDTVGDVARRDWDGNVKGVHYTDDSGRNDIAEAQVARDDRMVWFHVRCAEKLSPATDQRWMTLMVDTDENRATGYQGYDVMINRSRAGNLVSVETCAGNRWEWKKVADAAMHVEGRDLVIGVERKWIGGAGPLRFEFKWMDNVPLPPSETDFYAKGDCAPDGRFNFRYVEP